jgi:hypothetical protein
MWPISSQQFFKNLKVKTNDGISSNLKNDKKNQIDYYF